MNTRFEGASFPLAALVLGVAAYLTLGLVAMEIPSTATFPGPRFFPLIITVAAYAVAIGICVQSTRKHMYTKRTADPPGARTTAPDDSSTNETTDADEEPPMHWRMVLTVTASFLAFIVLLPLLGWLISASLLFFGVAAGLGAKNHLNSALIALTMSAVVQLCFAGGLGLQLPTGIFGGL